VLQEHQLMLAMVVRVSRHPSQDRRLLARVVAVAALGLAVALRLRVRAAPVAEVMAAAALVERLLVLLIRAAVAVAHAGRT
jgi:hypothetical protein